MFDMEGKWSSSEEGEKILLKKNLWTVHGNRIFIAREIQERIASMEEHIQVVLDLPQFT